MADFWSGAGGAIVGALIGAGVHWWLSDDGSQKIAELNMQLQDVSSQRSAAEEKATLLEEQNSRNLELLEKAAILREASESREKELIQQISTKSERVEALNSENLRINAENKELKESNSRLRTAQETSLNALTHLRANFDALFECVGAVMEFETLPDAINKLGTEKATTQLLCAVKALERFANDKEGYEGMAEANNGQILEALKNPDANASMFILIKSIIASQKEREQIILNSMRQVSKNSTL